MAVSVRISSKRSTFIAGVAAAALVGAFAPAAARAQAIATGQPAASASSDMEARLRALEAVVAALQTELQTERARAAATPVTLPPAVEARVAALETRAAAPAPDGFRVGNATVKFGGFVKTEALLTSFNDGPPPTMAPGGTAAREWYVPGATPVGGVGEDARLNWHAKQTRLTMTITPTVAGHTLMAYVEGDFETVPGMQGSQNVSNGYNFGLRRAYLTYDKWTFGQDWTTFMNTATLPETTDFIGSTDGTVFARQPVVRYTRKISDALTLVAAIENPETVTTGLGVGAAALTGGQDDDLLPDAIVRANFKNTLGEFSVAGIVRQLRVEDPASAFAEEAVGWGLSASGKIGFGPGKKNDVRFMLTHGAGIGRYLAVGFAPDAFAVNRPPGAATVRDLRPIRATAGLVNARFFLGERTRTTIGAQFIDVGNRRGFAAATANDEAWSAFANLFFSPVRGLDLGVEYRHGEREVFGGLDGSLDRIHLIAKQSF